MLHLVCETRVKDPDERDQLKADVAATIGSRTGVVPAAIHLVRPGSVPKTTSGKIRRVEIRSWLHAGTLPSV